MNRLAQVFTILIGTSAAVLGQSSWPSYPNNTAISVTSGGNVGIGLANAPASLFVQAPAGSVGTTVQVNGTAQSGTTLVLNNNNASFNNSLIYGYTSAGGSGFRLLDLRTNGGPTNAMWVDGAGNGYFSGTLGIGTQTPNLSYKLDVQGAIAAADIYVTSNALPDYVFDADYRNAPLSEVAAYIDQNHHLPGMPSAEEAEKNRLSVGDMQNKLLQKVEELTLHMIAAEEQNKKLEQQNRELQERFARLEARSGEIEGQRNGAGK